MNLLNITEVGGLAQAAEYLAKSGPVDSTLRIPLFDLHVALLKLKLALMQHEGGGLVDPEQVEEFLDRFLPG